MKTLILGHLGRMGKRYGAILDSLGVEWDGTDVLDPYSRLYHDYSHAIIATPTHTHQEEIEHCVAGVPFVLCEKPLCKSSEKCRELDLGDTDLRVVCNWSYVLPWRLKPGKHRVAYANWHTGSDGWAWDCCQLHHLTRDPMVGPMEQQGPLFNARIDGYQISLTDIDRSYIAMLKDWYEDPASLWGIEDAIAMEEKVEAILA